MLEKIGSFWTDIFWNLQVWVPSIYSQGIIPWPAWPRMCLGGGSCDVDVDVVMKHIWKTHHAHLKKNFATMELSMTSTDDFIILARINF